MPENKTYSRSELLERMGITELLTFDETGKVSAAAQAACGKSIWPNLSGNEIYALANAAANAYKKHEGRT